MRDIELEIKARDCFNCGAPKCKTGCPLGNDIPAFIHAITKGQHETAYEILTKTTVLSSVCGRICPHEKQCQGKCIRGMNAEPISIGALEAYIGDLAQEEGYVLSKEEDKEQKIAVVGSGPAGLACAAFLRRKGYQVTIFEKKKELGGILTHGIPDFRLPPEVTKRNIQKILDLEIQVETQKELGVNISLQELEDQYDAVFLGIGANVSYKMGILGEDLEGVYGGNELLEKKNHPDYTGKKVAIIGGGNVAMDAARTIKRLGAEKVSVLYRRQKEQMPAEAKEVDEAMREGVEFYFSTNVVKILGQKKVEKVECVQTKLVARIGDIRPVPINIEGSNYEIDVDYVVMAVGSKPEEKVLDMLGLELDRNGKISIDKEGRTSNEKVFAGGDIATSNGTVAWAAKDGKDAAEAIAKYLEAK